ncbi:vacuolar-processing enzyme-like [Silene latifolia]|uniref:vacuolar-processing enzyme-like n=1 Tax=Silene latifolia TaxID=37657 RepID=UPI003D78343F
MASTKSLTTMFVASFLFVIILYNIMDIEARITNEMLDTLFPSQLAPSQRWAILVAGSKHYQNYRHQSDICHAWQVLTDKGVPQENIVVFMYDDIAYHDMNPFQGVLRNSPSTDGFNVYEGVTKDYVGEDVTSGNIVSAFLGNANPGGVKGSGKIINSGANDYVFFYFSGHGEIGSLGK